MYAQKLRNLLGPDGRLLNHGIAHLYTDVGYHGDFTQRYVFPDGDPVQLSRMQLALERAGFVTEHVEEFGKDYYDTLGEWIKRLDENLVRAEQIAGKERLRVWRLYLRSAQNIFKTRVRLDLPDARQTRHQQGGEPADSRLAVSFTKILR